MSDETKDFRYYADKAEHQVQLSLGHEANGSRLLIDGDAKTRHVMRAQVFATLALGTATQGERCPALKVEPRERRKLKCDRPADHAGEHIDKTGTAF